MGRTSTIVMGTVVAGLFSLALWETLRKTPPPSCALQHPEIAMIEELRVARQAKLPSVAGAAVGSPGRYLAGVVLETPLDPAIADKLPTITRPTAEHPYQVTFTEEAGIVRAVEVVVGRFDATYDEKCEASEDPCACEFIGDDRAVCAEVGRLLHSTWGAPVSEGAAQSWVDDTTRARATLRGCVLTFDHAE